MIPDLVLQKNCFPEMVVLLVLLLTCNACKVLLSCLLSLLALCSRLDRKSMAKKGYNTKLVRLAS
jgi:hypothetical protein